MATPLSSRRYGGETAAERRAARRRKLLDTALRLYGAADAPAAPIETLCAEAKVSTSHFYEQYRSRDELLADLYDELSDRLFDAIATALADVPITHEALVRAGIGAFIDFLTADEAIARMLLIVPHAGADAMLPHRRATIRRTTELLESMAEMLVAAGELPARDYRLTSVALTGAGVELLSTWFLTVPRPPIEPVRDELIRMHLLAVRQF